MWIKQFITAECFPVYSVIHLHCILYIHVDLHGQHRSEESEAVCSTFIFSSSMQQLNKDLTSVRAWSCPSWTHTPMNLEEEKTETKEQTALQEWTEFFKKSAFNCAFQVGVVVDFRFFLLLFF